MGKYMHCGADDQTKQLTLETKSQDIYVFFYKILIHILFVYTGMSISPLQAP